VTTPLASALVAALRASLAALDPAKLVHDALPPSPPESGRVIVIAVGKASLAMARGALARWPDRLESVLTIGPTEETIADGRVTTIRAPHPIPDARSVAAADEALARAKALGHGDLLLALISGGASALMAAPAEGVDLAEKQAIVATLLDRGVPIRDVNVVRRHLSRIKGGRLARAATPATTRTLIVSDVIGGAPHDIGSGPTVADPTTIEDARAVLAHAGLTAPPAIAESWKPASDARAAAWIICDPPMLGRTIAADLVLRGVRASVAEPEEGDAAAIVERRVARTRTLAPGEALVIPCEPTLALPSEHGRGGRAGWIALAATRRLPDDVVLLCAASDGVDGSSGAAGAVVSRDDASKLDAHAIDAAITTFDDASAHRAMGTHVGGGPTGHNLTDVHVIARCRRS
jgi:glycerate 2-kinase